jgi:hypothetical protein
MRVRTQTHTHTIALHQCMLHSLLCHEMLQNSLLLIPCILTALFIHAGINLSHCKQSVVELFIHEKLCIQVHDSYKQNNVAFISACEQY